jgi:hypothetical protein
VKTFVMFTAAAFCCTTALGWNDKGHMVMAKLAWDKLKPAERQSAVTILKSHPHDAEFLAANRPDNVEEDVWVFMWPDWVRRRHPEVHLSFPAWHYINLPYMPPSSTLKESDFPAGSPNVVTQIPVAIGKVKQGTPEEKAIYFCWLPHHSRTV